MSHRQQHSLFEDLADRKHKGQAALTLLLCTDWTVLILCINNISIVFQMWAKIGPVQMMEQGETEHAAWLVSWIKVCHNMRHFLRSQ